MMNFSQLLSRTVIGLIFMGTGWGKLQNLDGVIEYFASLGIPAPQLQAPFVAITELVCGALIFCGFATRLASLPLIGTMIVAILTAKMSEIEGYDDLLNLSEFLLIIVLSWLVTAGGGCLSIDYILKRKFGTNRFVRFLT